jgi:hypothetical protein
MRANKALAITKTMRRPLRERLAPALRAHFPTMTIEERETSVAFPPVHSEVGEIEITDDSWELTVYVGHFTHAHFNLNGDDWSTDENAQEIIRRVVAYLKDIFEDRVVMWGSHAGSGGTYEVGKPSKHCPPNAPRFVWSGPYSDG